MSGINVTEKDVAVALGCMARSYTNMSGVGDGSAMNESNWNVENFVNVVIDVVSETCQTAMRRIIIVTCLFSILSLIGTR